MRKEADEGLVRAFLALPGGELIVKGLHDPAHHCRSREALVAETAAPSLAAVGIHVPDRRTHQQDFPELRLYRLLQEEEGGAAYSLYRSLLRRLARFQRSLSVPKE